MATASPKTVFSRRVAPFVPVALALTVGALTPTGGNQVPSVSASSLQPCQLWFEDIATRPDPAASCRFEGCFANDEKRYEDLAKNSFCIDASSPTDLSDFSVFRQLQARNDSKHTGDRSQLRAITPLGEGSIVRLAAYIKEAHISDCPGGEAVNCVENGFAANDIHIPLVQNPDDDECLSVTAEMSPHFRPAAWSEIDMRTPVGRLVRVTGPLFFDSSHIPCKVDDQNQISKRGSPARLSLWEIHPVYAIEVCDSESGTDCDVAEASEWTPYDQWVKKSDAAATQATGAKQRQRCEAAGPGSKPCAGNVEPP